MQADKMQCSGRGETFFDMPKQALKISIFSGEVQNSAKMNRNLGLVFEAGDLKMAFCDKKATCKKHE